MPGCPACALRRINPDWLEHPAAFRRFAFENGYTAPLQDLPDFPEPEPQDTFYYKLVQDPHALLHYMNLYSAPTATTASSPSSSVASN
jgi:hypothetical protein